MKLLCIGSSHRTHAVVWAARQHEKINQVFVAGYNAGVAQWKDVVMFPLTPPTELLRYALDHNIDMVWIDSENDILVYGDTFRGHGIATCAPSTLALSLTETSKAGGKRTCDKAGVPTTRWDSFWDYEEAVEYVKELFAHGEPGCAVKFDGLAGGKGVVVALSQEKALAALHDIFVEQKFGPPTVGPYWAVIEHLAEGEETSAMAACWGTKSVMLPMCRDKKRRGDGDTGPLTGSMGCTMIQKDQDRRRIWNLRQAYLEPILAALADMLCWFNGFLFPGLMGQDVLELNARLGGPEALPIIYWLGPRFIDLMFFACGLESIADLPYVHFPEVDEDFVCVVMADDGYPMTKARGGDQISGLERFADNPNVMVFHDGTEFRDGVYYTKKGAGRVLFVVARGANVVVARKRAYDAVNAIKFHNEGHRTDIGAREEEEYIQAP